MHNPPTSQRLHMPTTDNSQSISQIQHQQLRISFSILSILHPEDNHTLNTQNLNCKISPSQQQYHQKYVQLPKQLNRLTDTASPSSKFKNTTKQPSNKSIQHFGEYFNPTQILTPKIHSSRFQKLTDTSNKSSKRDPLSKINQSNSKVQLRKQSYKKPQFGKKISKPFDLQTRHQKRAQNFYFKLKNGPYSPRTGRNGSRGKIKERNQSCKEFHGQKLYKNKDTNKILQIYKQSNKQNLIPKQTVQKKVQKSANKHLETSKKGTISQKQIAKASSDYWSSGFDIITKHNNKKDKTHKKCVFKKSKQKIKSY